MVSSFWQKGFYFNGSLFFFHSIQFTSLRTFFGISSYFTSLLFLRFDWFTINSFFKKTAQIPDEFSRTLWLKKSVSNTGSVADLKNFECMPASLLPAYSTASPQFAQVSYLASGVNRDVRGMALTSLSSVKYQTLTFTFNNFLVVTYPVLLSIRAQQKFNIFFFYMIRSSRGISLKLGKPIRRKTRGRTYLNFYWTKPKKAYQMYNTTRRWF